MANAPRGRKKTYGTGGGNANKVGGGLGLGKVGSGSSVHGSSPIGGGGGGKRSGGGINPLLLIIAAVVLLGGGGGVSSLLGGGSGSSSSGTGYETVTEVPSTQSSTSSQGGVGSLLGQGNSGSSSQSSSGAGQGSSLLGQNSSSQSAGGYSQSGSGLSSLFGGGSSSGSPFGSFGNTYSSDWGSYASNSEGGYSTDPYGLYEALFGSAGVSSGSSQASSGTGSTSSGSASSLTGQTTPSQVAQSGVSQSASTVTNAPVYAVGNNTGTLNTAVNTSARKRYTTIKGNGQDTVTIMVFMCGADLESRSGMATRDIMEMAKADLSNINLIIYTGGASKWNNRVISNQVNQIYRVKDGGLERLEQNAGTGAMTNPDTLSSFIKYCAAKFPADRNELIFWDHGGGTISGYGYDEKNQRAGSMNLTGINKALKDGGVKFDMIGFDTCLMATTENALMLTGYGDYMVASEESEPGIGWYYTDWLTKFNRNTSMDTVEIGKNIVDDFITTCASQCRGQKATLSVVDLAELQMTLPIPLNTFSKGTTQLIKNNQYKVVSDARNTSREFAQSSRIDQVDFIDLAQKIGTTESINLAKTLASAIKYNRTSSNMTNAYGLSVYFPYARVSQVDNAVKINNAIGIDSEYSKLLQEFASLETSGQVAAGGSYSPLQSLFGDFTGTDYGSSAYDSSELVQQLLGSFLSGGYGSVSGLSGSNSGYLSGRDLSTKEVSDYIAYNHFDASQLQWEIVDGQHLMSIDPDQWNYIHDLTLNMFKDDGEGFIDLGRDNVYEFTEDGKLIGDTDGTWLSLNGQICAYYYLDMIDDGDKYTITGYVPVLLNGERMNLLLVFDDENEEGYVAGVTSAYVNGETDTIAKSETRFDEEGNVLPVLQDGDVIQCLCDYHNYDGSFDDSYMLGDPITVEGDVLIRNDVVMGEGEEGALRVTYRFTDIYNQVYWTPAFVEE